MSADRGIENYDLTLGAIVLVIAIAGIGSFFGVSADSMGVGVVIPGLLVLAGRYAPKQ